MARSLNQILQQKIDLNQQSQADVVSSSQGKGELFSNSQETFSSAALPPVAPKNPYISHPHQLRALQLAEKFNDQENKIQYLKLTKSLNPALIDLAESFVSDANANNKAALFMWKVKQIKQEWQAQNKNWRHPHPPQTKKTTTKSSAHRKASAKSSTKKGQQSSLF